MVKKTGRLAAIFAIILLCTSWGFYSHRRISYMAVFTLPPPMIRFYKNNISFISDHSVDPDKKRYTDPEEGARHFWDSERYGKKPFDSIPVKWNDAVTKYTADTLKLYGTVPWQIEKTYYRLVNAFKERDSIRILRMSANLSHYISDAHVPLHATQNYNGQFTNQTGIHAFWESRLPELFSQRYDFAVGKARYIENPLKEAWSILKGSYSGKDSVFSIEKELSEKFPSDKKYSYSERNGKIIRQYSLAYSAAYHKALKGMVEKRMRSAILETGCFWYSAWVDAGQPDLSGFKTGKSKRTQSGQEDDQPFKNTKILGRPDL
ncbi:zinc dependent phospholipase C family protein [Pararcticibacter amylolyticus]|uniref:S1/P1 Nuclease n=1 Tax=Pararcticibacter amylolyticus TaxID=2173175 RepID=A0A2U2PE15_9SPHI|nr:zinc dependent phospholipase C family protein [Pararcticibacter amylolyticus]PWG79645.1 S1/P1 Nuclease [Pararcticibacter amylolyticus]